MSESTRVESQLDINSINDVRLPCAHDRCSNKKDALWNLHGQGRSKKQQTKGKDDDGVSG